MSRAIQISRTGRKISVVLALLLVLGLGCASPSGLLSTSSPVASPESTQPRQSPTAPISPVPTPDPDWGTVTGKLVRSEDDTPIVGVIVFLEQTTEEHGVPPVLYAPPNDQPRARTNEQGEFAISGVPSDEYVMILYSPPYAIQVVTESSANRPLLIDAKRGKVTNVGPVRVTEFELP